MARQPQHRSSIRENWAQGLIGTPRRFLCTLAVLLIIIAMFSPATASWIVSNIVNAIIMTFGPSIGPLFMLAFAVWIIWNVMLRPFFPKKKGKSDH